MKHFFYVEQVQRFDVWLYSKWEREKKFNREIRRNDEASKENEAHKSRHKEAKESQYEYKKR